jgi:hypothetical protein
MFFLLASPLLATAQWNIPGRLVLDGSTPGDRQVRGVAAPEQPTDGAPMTTERVNAGNVATASGTDDLSIDLVPAPAALAPGMRILLIPSAVNQGPVSVQVNGLPAVDVRKYAAAPLDSADLRPGVPVELVFDGSVFHVGGQLYPGCPPGFKALGRTTCVEATSREPLNWYAANVTCANEGKRLCGFSEWIRACLQQDNIFGSVVDYEWVDEAANSTNLAKLMGVNETTLQPDCYAGGHRVPTSTQRYRCCYDR